MDPPVISSAIISFFQGTQRKSCHLVDIAEPLATYTKETAPLRPQRPFMQGLPMQRRISELAVTERMDDESVVTGLGLQPKDYFVMF
jgi:hypothetical protein